MIWARLADIDRLFSAIDMLAMDGFELLRKLCVARPALPVILMAHPEMLNQPQPIDPGHYQLSRSPFNGQELLC